MAVGASFFFPGQTSQLVRTIRDYSRKFDIEASAVLVFDFNEDICALISDRFEFDPEESNIAPGPSIGCRVRSASDIDYAAVYLQYASELVIFAEAEKDPEEAKQDFLKEVPELHPYLKR